LTGGRPPQKVRTIRTIYAGYFSVRYAETRNNTKKMSGKPEKNHITETIPIGINLLRRTRIIYDT
jgi:hypothetical protein